MARCVIKTRSSLGAALKYENSLVFVPLVRAQLNGSGKEGLSRLFKKDVDGKTLWFQRSL
ncbi:hypothetical protein XI03_20325 [Bradyrhizobium sp. CCBAU 65884]|nr:hypothetical protein [Bradyrhizobium sp. CCBAU 65884]